MGGILRRRGSGGLPRARPSANVYKGSCRGKVGYSSKHLAEGRLRVKLKEPGVVDADRLDVYSCKICGAWHLGTRRGGAHER